MTEKRKCLPHCHLLNKMRIVADSVCAPLAFHIVADVFNSDEGKLISPVNLICYKLLHLLYNLTGNCMTHRNRVILAY